MNKRKTTTPQIWQSAQGAQATVPTCIYITHQNALYPQNPLLVSDYEEEEEEAAVKLMEGDQGRLRFAYICACIYTLSRRSGRSYGWCKPGPVGGWTESGTGAPEVLAPTNLGSSLTLDGSKARDDGGACRRAGAAAAEALPFIHGGGGLHRELVLEICLEKDKHTCIRMFPQPSSS